MTCPRCGIENPAGQRFCGNCGNPLAFLCASCGTANPPGQRFCGSCGTTLAADAAASPSTAETTPSAPTTERRLVSVLFADLVGFTTLSESRDPEDVRELLSRYFDDEPPDRRALRRRGREVHRRRRHGRVGLADRARGRRRARRPRRARAHGGCAGSARTSARPTSARARASSPAKPPSTSEPRTRGWSPATSSTLRRGSSRSRRPAPVFVGESTRRATEAVIAYEHGRAARAQGQGRRRSSSGGRRGSSGTAGRPRRRRSSHPSSAATASCG